MRIGLRNLPGRKRRALRGAPPGHMVGGNEVTLLHDGVEAFPAMLRAIEAAEVEILLDMYWFHSDRTGWDFAHALIEKARQGVTVLVIYDAVGSWEADVEMFEAMRTAGCVIHEFNPVAPWRKRFNIGVVNRRDHRKMLVVDGHVGMTGGINLGDPWAPAERGGEGWRDDMIRIEGPAAMQMRSVFVHTWVALEGEVPGVTPQVEREGLVEEGESRVRVLSNSSSEHRTIRREYLARIEAARDHVLIANSYFVPDRVVRRALAAAVRRGVDVRVLLPGDGDVLAVFYAARRLYGWLLRHGIQLYEWPRTVLHSKTAVIDAEWCTVGSYNIDYRSWRFNLELNVAVEDRGVGEAMRRRFAQDLAASVPVSHHDWRFRPLSARLMENFFYMFRKLL